MWWQRTCPKFHLVAVLRPLFSMRVRTTRNRTLHLGQLLAQKSNRQTFMALFSWTSVRVSRCYRFHFSCCCAVDVQICPSWVRSVLEYFWVCCFECHDVAFWLPHRRIGSDATYYRHGLHISDYLCYGCVSLLCTPLMLALNIVRYVFSCGYDGNATRSGPRGDGA